MPTVTVKLLQSGGVVVGNERRTMDKKNQGKKREQWRKGLAAGTALAALTLIPGCSSVPDAVNPAHWYDSASGWFSGEEDAPAPEDAAQDTVAASDDTGIAPRRPAQATGGLARGLVPDRDHAQYARTDLNRDGNPTRSLSGGAPVSAPVATVAPTPAVRAEAAPQAAPIPAPAAIPESPSAPKAVPPAPALAAVPAAPAVEAADTMPAPLPAPAPAISAVPQAAPVPVPVPPSPSVSAPVPAPEPPSAPVAASVPAPVAAVPAARPVAQRAAAPAAETIEQAYNRRLAEFNTPVSSSSAPVPVPPVATPSAAVQAAPVALTRPVDASSSARPAQKRSPANGVHPLADYRAGGGASFQVAILSFGEGTAALPQGAQASLQEIAALVKGGARSVRIVGYSLSSRLDVDPSANLDANRELAAERADAVARELIRLGVPARKIYAGPGTDLERARWASAAGSEATEINIDY